MKKLFQILNKEPYFQVQVFLNALNIKYELWNVMLGSQIKAVICLTISEDKKKVILNDKIIYGGIIFNTDFQE